MTREKELKNRSSKKMHIIHHARWILSVGAFIAVFVGALSCKPPKPVSCSDTTFTIGAATGALIQPLLGVNAGPAPAGNDPRNADLTDAYHQIGVNLIRTHDFYGPLDMAVMYPDRTRDPEDQRSYAFQASDEIWQRIVNGGFEPYLRLGDSWNNATPPTNSLERAYWVRAAVQVVSHYHAGLWNGFTTPLRYVEIWNEPDFQQFWQKPHTPLEFFQLYAETATAVKQAFPEVQVGGPGVTQAAALSPNGRQWLRDFLQYVKQQDAPLDFFSWHLYSNVPDDWDTAAAYYRTELDEQGFQTTTLHLTEWNTDTKNLADNSTEAHALRTGGKGAAILTAAWMALQQHEIEVATLYRGTDPSLDIPTFYGIFYADGSLKRIALAFSLWAKLAQHPQRLTVAASAETPLKVICGKNEAGEIALLMVNPSETTLCYSIEGLIQHTCNIEQVSDASDQIEKISADTRAITIGAYRTQFLIW